MITARNSFLRAALGGVLPNTAERVSFRGLTRVQLGRDTLHVGVPTIFFSCRPNALQRQGRVVADVLHASLTKQAWSFLCAIRRFKNAPSRAATATDRVR